MTKTLKLNKSTDEGVIDLLRFLLDNKKIGGVFSLKKIEKDKTVAYCLITDSDELKDAVPFFPLMPVNAGNLLSRFTLKSVPKKPIVAVVKPCEMRGFVELIKREQGSLENIFIISFTCGGVFPTKTQVDKTLYKNIEKYWDSAKKGEIFSDLRPTCKACDEFVPYNADITVDIVGKNDFDKKCLMFLNTKLSEDLTKDFKGELSTGDLDSKKIEKIKLDRLNEKKKLYDEIGEKLNGIDGLIDIFGKCISCHGCSKVCPICYCTLCEFESPDSEYKPSNFESELQKRGGIRVPPGTVYFHLGRLTHISISCVACGACDDVCPVDIPVALIFKKIGESLQKRFDYVSGKNIDEKIPLITFNKEEFTEIEE